MRHILGQHFAACFRLNTRFHRFAIVGIRYSNL